MANLLPRKNFPKPLSKLDPEHFERYVKRLEGLVAVLRRPPELQRLTRRLSAFEVTLEELESEPSLVTAQDLLDGFARARDGILGEGESGYAPSVSADSSSEEVEGPRAGGLLCYWPGRSLSTGEAELASRGFFDGMDRPPLALWLEAVARPTGSVDEAYEVAILVWVPDVERARAQAGRRACGTGALAFVEEVSPALAEQLEPVHHEVMDRG